MRHDTINGYFGDLSVIRRDARRQYADVWAAWKRAEDGYHAAVKSLQLSDAETAAGKKLLQAAVNERKELLAQIREQADKDLADCRKGLSEHLDGIYRATPAKLDAAAITLLNTGILTAQELSALADQYADNPPMQRVIASYAEKMEGDRDAERLARVLKDKASHGDAYLQNFDVLSAWIRKGIGDIQEVADAMDSHFDGAYTETINGL